MNMISKRLLIASFAGAFLLSACGGSSDDGAGSPTTFSVSPAEKGVSGGGACYVGFVGRFFVSGGVAPYQIRLSDPDAFSFTDPAAGTTTEQTRVNNRDGSFDVWARGICVDPSSAIVFDDTGRRFEVSLTNTTGS
jgi:hypothetical protein